MNSIEQMRRRRVGIGLLSAGIALLIFGPLFALGAVLIADSSGGTSVAPSGFQGPVRRLPATRTALIGVADSSNRLTSVAALSLHPSGYGGTIMPISASADIGAGRTGTLSPLAANVAQNGADAFLSGSQAITNLSFDMAEIVDVTHFEQLFGSVGQIDVELPFAVANEPAETEWPAGPNQLTVAGAAELITATNSWAPDWYLDAVRYDVWKGVGVAASAASANTDPPAPTTELPANTEAFVSQLLSGPVSVRGLGIVSLDDTRIASQFNPDLKGVFGADIPASIVVHDSSEVAIVGSAVAPGRVGAPLEAPNYRLVVGDDPAAVQAKSMTTEDVAKLAVDRLAFSKINVPSVALLASPLPDVTKVSINDEEQRAAVQQKTAELFGPVEVVVADEPIIGIDVEVTLGRSFLEVIEPPKSLSGPTTMEATAGAVQSAGTSGTDAVPPTGDTAPGATQAPQTDGTGATLPTAPGTSVGTVPGTPPPTAPATGATVPGTPATAPGTTAGA